MIDWSRKQSRLYGSRTRIAVPVICPDCQQERWVQVDNLKLMKSELCTSCARTATPRIKSGEYRPCKICGKPMWVKSALKNRKVYCSKACQSFKVQKACATCGKPFWVKRGLANQAKTCSRKCAHEQFRNRIVKICPTCGKIFETIPSQNATHCSRTCYEQKGQNNPNYRNGLYTDDKPYPFPYGGSWESIRKAIKERDGHVCQYPGCSSNCRLHVHHKIRPQDCASLAEANDPDNLITYCLRHHQQLHRHKQQVG